MTRLVFADLETTGTDPTRHHLWEVALIVRQPDGDVEYCWQVRPDLTTADPMALKIGRYYERTDWGGVPTEAICTEHPARSKDDRSAAQVATELAQLLNGAVLAAANVAFDAAFLDRFLRANGQAPSWDYHLLEVESYTAGALGAAPPWKLNSLATDLRVVLPTDRHSALADARLVRDVYDAARLRAN